MLGSGLVSAPLLDFLVNKCSRQVLLVSAVASELEKAAKRFPAISTKLLNVTERPDEVGIHCVSVCVWCRIFAFLFPNLKRGHQPLFFFFFKNVIL